MADSSSEKAADKTTAKVERAEIRKTTDKVRESAKHIEGSAQAIRTTADRSTQLAADRTVYAAERTYAAWIRTGLGALASGIGVRTLLDKLVPAPLILFGATVLVLFSVFCFVAGVWRELVPAVQDPVPTARRIPAPILYFINGSLALVALAALVGIWF
jgi:putative membrane protein